jgi:hypothetical protein
LVLSPAVNRLVFGLVVGVRMVTVARPEVDPGWFALSNQTAFINHDGEWGWLTGDGAVSSA